MGLICCACCGTAENAPFPRKEGRKEARTITDCFCMVLFYVMAALMVVVVMDGFTQGDIKRLTHGADWEGNLCGIDTVVADKPYMIFCGSPERSGNFPKFIIQGSSACVAACPGVPAAGTPQVEIDCLMPAYHNFTTYKEGSIGGLENIETLQMTLTQSVTTQYAYPTEEFGGRFCLPSSENPGLRDLIIDGPWGKFYRPLAAVGGLRDAWPLFVLSAGLAFLLGLIYMSLLQRYAGVLIFVTMVLGTLLSLALGLFFFWSVFMDMNDRTTVYAKFNPIMSVYLGEEAQIYSVITGIIIMLFTVVMGAVAATSITHIDESIGLIAAATECWANGCSLQLYPLFQGGLFCVICVVFFFFGLPAVMSLGSLDYSEITVDGEDVSGLQRIWKRNWLQHSMLVFYVIGCFFLLEFYIQMGHYIVSYTVCCWYFNGGKMVPVDNFKGMNKAFGAGGKQVEVRVAGVDPNYGPRQGSVMQTSAGKMLVVPVGRKGPGLGRLDMETQVWQKDPVPMFAMTQGVLTAIFYHIGSIAIGSPVIFFFRPFRMVGKFMHHFTHKTKEPEPHWNAHKAHHRDETSAVRGCISLIVSALDQLFGQFSCDAFTELVLDGSSNFMSCCSTSFMFLVKSGGSIAHLHGSMMMFEIFGCFFITMFCTWTCLIVQDKVDEFNEPTNARYIEDKSASTIACAVIAFAISFSFMSTWNQIADILLYCVAWNRQQLHEGEVHKYEHNEIIPPVNKFCPQNLRYLMPPHEREAEYNHGLHGHGAGMGHAMQILATLEHGIMNTLSGEAEGSMAGSH